MELLFEAEYNAYMNRREPLDVNTSYDDTNTIDTDAIALLDDPIELIKYLRKKRGA